MTQIDPRKWKHRSTQKILHECLEQPSAQWCQSGDNPNDYQQVNEILLGKKKQWNTDHIRKNMDDSQSTILREKFSSYNIYTVWYHLYKLQGQTKLISGDRNQNIGCWSELMERRWEETFLGVLNL
jgi:hypothetical protein